ncbi:acyltransferase family protein [Desulforamulus ruminis]|uniref:acyltransferase family protein n=1 Tax=Desulforamulus ruminis TaxID=1564 RepID=UPI0023575817|nr:acyltransferase [Desulforamulus ruminis]
MMSGNTALPRKNYIDNIRSATIVLVLIYHVVYIFNSVGVVSNIPVQGIPALDSICYFLYPWFMCLLFVVAGISARYSLQTRSTRQFARERVQKLIVPYLGGAFLLGWLNGWVTAHYVDMFGGHAVPGFVKYLVYCLNIGPLWFLLELFVISMILLLILRIDRRDRLWALAGKTGLPLIILLVLAVWGSSFLLNPPVVVVFRNGIYWLMFLLGYYVFSHDTVLAKLKQHAILFFIIAVGLGVVEVWYFFGQNYTSDACLQHPLNEVSAKT